MEIVTIVIDFERSVKKASTDGLKELVQAHMDLLVGDLATFGVSVKNAAALHCNAQGEVYQFPIRDFNPYANKKPQKTNTKGIERT